MAEQQNMASGFPNLSNLNPEGLGDEYGKNINAIQKTLDDLEARYQQPNWFKIAAGFAKPQLGGFVASLGSAAEAQGENIEQQRRLAIPLAQMRAQLGVQSAVMGQNKAAADYLDNWQKDHPGQPIPQDVYERASSISPNTPRVQAVGKSLEVGRAEQGLAIERQKAAMSRVNAAIALHQTPDPNDLAAAGMKPPQALAAETPAAVPAGTPAPTPAPKLDAGSLATSLGVPIISGTRDHDEQQKLWDESVAAGRTGVTPQGNPIAKPGTSKHETGMAIDVDSSKFTDEHKKALTDNGFVQPMPKQDPNHWELKTAAPTSAVSKKYDLLHPQVNSQELSMLPADQAKEILDSRRSSAKVAEDNSAAIIQDLSRFTNPAYYTPYMDHVTAAKNLIQKNQGAAARVFDVMGTGDIQSQIMKAAQEGGGFHTGVFSGQINLPAEAWVKAGLSKELASYANDIATHLLAASTLKNRMMNANTANPPVAEFQALQNAMPNLHQRWDSALNALKQDSLDIFYQNKLHDAYMKDLVNVDRTHEMAPYTSVIHHSKRASDVKSAWNKDKQDLRDAREAAFRASLPK